MQVEALVGFALAVLMVVMVVVTAAEVQVPAVCCFFLHQQCLLGLRCLQHLRQQQEQHDQHCMHTC